uniref:Nuclear RNA export factor 2 n=1 Tax=Strongyloides stercoralis TaxID=6248 RepID=A0A0K0DXT9_STRER
MLPSKDLNKYQKSLENATNIYFKDFYISKSGSNKNVNMNNTYKYKGFLKNTGYYHIKITNAKDLSILSILRDYCDFIPLSTGILPSNTITFWVAKKDEADSLTLLSRRIIQNDSLVQINSEPGKYRIWGNLTDDNIKTINDVCSLRYSPEDNSLDLTSFLHEDVFNNDECSGITLEKVDVVLTVAKFILSECPNVEKISFSSNHLRSLECLEPILHVAKKTHTIDISFNFINNITCFNILKRFKFKEIYAKEFQSDKFFYLDEKYASSHISTILQTTTNENDGCKNNNVVHNPKLNFNDFSDFSTHFQYEEHFLATGPVSMSFFNNIPNLEKVIKTFTQSYIFTFDDCNFEQRRNLKRFYCSKATFSLCISPIQDGRRYQYYYGKEQIKSPKNSEFLSKTHNMEKPEYYQNKLHEVFFNGSERIINALLTLPLSQHDVSTFVYDVTYSDVNIVIFTVKGLVNFGESRYSNPLNWISEDVKIITRSFVCSIQKNSVIKIISEIMNIYPSINAGLMWYRKSLTLFELSNSNVRLYGKVELEKRKKEKHYVDKLDEISIDEKHRNYLLERLCYETKMTPQYSLRCLMDCNYDYHKSLEIFEAIKDSIPKEAFDSRF